MDTNSKIDVREGAMRKTVLTYVIAFAIVSAFAGAASADHHAVKVSAKDGIGKFLVDAKGMTLYIFKKDSIGKSACAGQCLERWPVYYRETVAAPEGVIAGHFSTITREDGGKQTAYKGLPLYYFAGDKAPGDTMGQGVGGVWYVANP
jgi:predicted lipoprotein with Yx(FWY)xxD motif